MEFVKGLTDILNAATPIFSGKGLMSSPISRGTEFSSVQSNQQTTSVNVNPNIFVTSPGSTANPSNIIETRPISDVSVVRTTEDDRGGALPGFGLESNIGIEPAQVASIDGSVFDGLLPSDNTQIFILVGAAAFAAWALFR